MAKVRGTGRIVLEECPDGFRVLTQRPFLRYWWRTTGKPALFPSLRACLLLISQQYLKGVRETRGIREGRKARKRTAVKIVGALSE